MVDFEGITNIKNSFWAAAFTGLLTAQGAMAQEGRQIDAEYIMSKLSPDEQTVYFSGVIEGLAYARYMEDGGSTDGMMCIYDWFAQDRNLRMLRMGFEEWPESAPGVIVGVLVERACP